MLRIPWITPNLLTCVAVALAFASGVAFLGGVPVLGAVLFEASFVVDCLDGKVARLRKITSPLGAFLDTIGDTFRIAWVYSSIGLMLASKGALPARLSLLPAVAALVWIWSNVQLQLARRASAGNARDAATTGVIGRVDEWLCRRRLARLPGSVDAAALALFLAPLTNVPAVMVFVLWAVAGGFYLLVAMLNLKKILTAMRSVSEPGARPAAAAVPRLAANQ